MATTKQVADFYEVSEDAIKQIVVRNKDEVIQDGYTVYTSKEIKSFYSDNKSLQKIESYRGYFIINFENESVRLGNGKTGLFPKRAILRIGMLLRDSKVAKEIRTQLLNIII